MGQQAALGKLPGTEARACSRQTCPPNLAVPAHALAPPFAALPISILRRGPLLGHPRSSA